jgi:hypothetical protein
MPFEFSDQHISDYHQLGFTIFRDVIPAKLMTDLRVQMDKAREIARKRGGDQAQRLQPLVQFEEIDMKPIDEYQRLPKLVHAVNRLFEDRFGAPVDLTATRSVMGVLVEPATRPWCTMWHRDWRDNIGGLDLEAWGKVRYDIRMFNQINCALYQDGSTWVVPGSHLRDDTDGEIRYLPSRPIVGPDTSALSNEEAEVRCLEYCKNMPGSFQAKLNAGDFMLYRNSLWHIGNYVPYCKRATIHDGLFDAKYEAFFKNPPIRKGTDGKNLTDFTNPNAHRLAGLGV